MADKQIKQLTEETTVVSGDWFVLQKTSNDDTVKVDADNILPNLSVTNAKLATGAGEPGGAWTSWTPTFTNLAGGTITYAKYTQVGKAITFRLKYSLGGAGVSGAVSLTPPVARKTASGGYETNDSITGTAVFTDVSTGALAYGPLLFNASGNLATFVWNASTTFLSISNLTSTVPFTWASGDAIVIAGTYEAS